jgi:hypothetical protein
MINRMSGVSLKEDVNEIRDSCADAAAIVDMHSHL